MSRLFTICALLWSCCIFAADGESPIVWLKSGDYARVDAYYSGIQHAYESGQINDRRLYEEFHKLYDSDIDNEASYDRWVFSYPKSYVAILARGTYLYRMGVASRGDLALDMTSSLKLAGMDNFMRRARVDLLASVPKTAKPYLSYLHLMNVAIMDGPRIEVRRSYNAGRAIDPDNWFIRLRYMFSLRPRWGGSYEQMRAFLQENEDRHAKPALLARLAMLIHADLAEDAMSRNQAHKDKRYTPEVFEEWGQVLSLAKIAGEKPSTVALVSYARAAWDLKKPAEADQALAALSKRRVDNAWGLSQMGWIYAQQNRDAEAWPLVLRAAELDDPWAQFAAGRVLYRGYPDLHVTPDRVRSLQWLRRAADQCEPNAIKFLAEHENLKYETCTNTAYRSRSERSFFDKARSSSVVHLHSDRCPRDALAEAGAFCRGSQGRYRPPLSFETYPHYRHCLYIAFFHCRGTFHYFFQRDPQCLQHDISNILIGLGGPWRALAFSSSPSIYEHDTWFLNRACSSVGRWARPEVCAGMKCANSAIRLACNGFESKLAKAPSRIFPIG